MPWSYLFISLARLMGPRPDYLPQINLPSGLDPDTGMVMDPHIVARATLTLAAPKAGLLASQAKPVVGELYVGDISVPGGVYEQLGLTAPGAMFDSGPIVRVMRE
jgi:NAD(P)H-hydrate epimerase